MLRQSASRYHQTQYLPFIFRKGTVMKTMSCALLLFAMFAFVLLGCSDNSAPVESSTSATDNPPTSLMKTSESGGATIITGEALGAYSFLDWETGLYLTLGINDLTKFCERTPPYLDEYSFRQIYLPNADPELQRVIQRVVGTDVTAMVFQVVPGSATNTRGYICGKVPLMVGTATLVRKDNDTFDQDVPPVKTFGYKANGTLVAPDGQKYMLNFVWYIVCHDGDIANAKENFKLQLTPTGNQ